MNNYEKQIIKYNGRYVVLNNTLHIIAGCSNSTISKRLTKGRADSVFIKNIHYKEIPSEEREAVKAENSYNANTVDAIDSIFIASRNPRIWYTIGVLKLADTFIDTESVNIVHNLTNLASELDRLNEETTKLPISKDAAESELVISSFAESPIEYNGKKVITTKLLAQIYETNENVIHRNFNNNKNRFVEEEHYFWLKGDELAAFKDRTENLGAVEKGASQLYIWTYEGVMLHCKSLTTDKAWGEYSEHAETESENTQEESADEESADEEIIENNQLTIADLAESPIEYNGQRVITTKVLAQIYDTNINNIINNFNRNKNRFAEGQHYFCLKGAELAAFKGQITNCDLLGSIGNALYLWTRKGASRHCKSLGTDRAWEQFDELENCYFLSKEFIESKADVLSKNDVMPASQKRKRLTKIEKEIAAAQNAMLNAQAAQINAQAAQTQAQAVQTQTDAFNKIVITMNNYIDTCEKVGIPARQGFDAFADKLASFGIKIPSATMDLPNTHVNNINTQEKISISNKGDYYSLTGMARVLGIITDEDSGSKGNPHAAAVHAVIDKIFNNTNPMPCDWVMYVDREYTSPGSPSGKAVSSIPFYSLNVVEKVWLWFVDNANTTKAVVRTPNRTYKVVHTLMEGFLANRAANQNLQQNN